MKILSHRGFWESEREKNTIESLERSFKAGFGAETDIRDLSQNLVISHDPPQYPILTIDSFFKLYTSIDGDLLLALNIKADGLQKLLKEKIEQYLVTNYFVFDMSIPETLQYIKNEFNVFSRQSEFEEEPLFYEKITGVWLDCFTHDWIREEVIHNHLKHGKKVCIVSPELHKRDYHMFWEQLAKMSVLKDENFLLCTDFPLIARDFFNVTN
jgi:glycerophosphoryl diester phosphodiesterase